MTTQQEYFTRVKRDLLALNAMKDFPYVMAYSIGYEYKHQFCPMHAVQIRRYINHCYDLLRDD